jgi:hypothetical protein
MTTITKQQAESVNETSDEITAGVFVVRDSGSRQILAVRGTFGSAEVTASEISQEFGREVETLAVVEA